MSQIFKSQIPNELLFDYLDLNSNKNKSYYEFNNYNFKKSLINKSIENFLNNIEKYYYNSKKKYVKRNITYKNLLTIIRQICKANHISFCSKIKYLNNTYEIIYFIYFN
jgi:hypothetical protein